MKYKNIIGGTQEDAEKKFTWLKEADFENAEIDISNDWLIWEDGVWKSGIWEGGNWEDGVWIDGIWEDGKMWDNLEQTYQKVEYKDGKFIKVVN